MHASVLLKEAVDNLDLRSGKLMVDGTFGSGGHTREVCERFGKDVKVLAIDLDKGSIERGTSRLSGIECDVTLREGNFRDVGEILREAGLEAPDAILLDLGWSMDQFEESGRGFSFRRDEPLSMTLKAEKTDAEFDAADIVNTWKEEDIANVLYGYGEERFARRIAREIVEQRDEKPIKTTKDLVDIVMGAVPASYRFGRIHPATKTFQALRIAVNDELRSLSEVLTKGFEILKPGGRMAIITFHSLEDRIVKNFFKEKVVEEKGELISKKPIAPSDEELQENPRARSAKLRVIRKQ